MKKQLLKMLVAASLIGGLSTSATAQNPMTERTNAAMSLETYTLSRNPADLEKAKTSIDYVVGHEKTKTDPKSWRSRGKIYSKMSLDTELKSKYTKAGLDAYKSYTKALDLDLAKLKAKNKPESKLPSKLEYKLGFEEAAIALFNGGADAFNTNDHENSYNHFSGILGMRAKVDPLMKQKLEFQFKEIEAVRLAGVSAVKIGKIAEGEKLLMQLMKDEGTKDNLKAGLYNLLAGAYFENKENDKAKAILKTAREAHPTDQALLITEINIALAEGRLSELEEQLLQAVNANKDNVELMFVMGNMYDELFRGKLEAGDDPKSKEYFEKGVSWYQKAVDKKPDHYNSIYSLGAIHVNYSNSYAKKINKITDMRSKEYKALDKKYNEMLDKGLEHLLAAEKIQPNDIGLLVALKDVYGRKGEDEKFMEYKKRLEEAQRKRQEEKDKK